MLLGQTLADCYIVRLNAKGKSRGANTHMKSSCRGFTLPPKTILKITDPAKWQARLLMPSSNHDNLSTNNMTIHSLRDSSV
jgi:hypothetical protein